MGVHGKPKMTIQLEKPKEETRNSFGIVRGCFIEDEELGSFLKDR